MAQTPLPNGNPESIPKSIEPVRWDESLSVGHKKIDEQHQILIGMLNTLIRNLGHESYEKMKDTIFGLIKYIHIHFNFEEKIMNLVEFEELAIHRGYHEALEEKVEQIRDQWNENPTQKELGYHLAQFIKTWILNHIQKEDTKLQPYLTKTHSTDKQ